MNNSKNQAYQQKILQLLLREKAVEAVNQTLTRENSSLKDRLKAIAAGYQHKIQEVKVELGEKVSKAELEIRLAKRGRVSLEQKNAQLQTEICQISKSLSDLSLQRQRLQEKYKQLQRQLSQMSEQSMMKSSALIELEQKYKKQEERVRKLSQQNANSQARIQQFSKQNIKLIKNLSQAQADLEEHRQLYKNAAQKIENQVAVKTRLKLQKQDQNAKYETMLQQLIKENTSLKDRRKKFEDDIKALQAQNQELKDAYKRIEKVNKKNKETIAENEAKTAQIQDERLNITEKARNLDRYLKIAKRQIEQLQQRLQNVDEQKSSQLNRFKKYEMISKSQRQQLQKKQRILQELQQSSTQLKKQLSAAQRNVLQLQLQVQKLTKENKYLSEQCQQQQQKRILSEAERQKTISLIIKEKDILSRSNFKLLQLLQLKDQAIKAILQSVQNKTDRIQLAPALDGDELLRQIRSADKEKLRNGKQRVFLLQEWIKNKR